MFVVSSRLFLHIFTAFTGLTPLMANNRDYETLLRAWKGWRDATGKKLKTKYAEYVKLNNEGVREAPGGKLICRVIMRENTNGF